MNIYNGSSKQFYIYERRNCLQRFACRRRQGIQRQFAWMKNQKLNKEKMIEKLLSLAFACTLLAPVFFSFNVIYKSYVGFICILYITDMNISGPILILQYTCPFITLCSVFIFIVN